MTLAAKRQLNQHEQNSCDEDIENISESEHASNKRRKDEDDNDSHGTESAKAKIDLHHCPSCRFNSLC